MRNAIPIQLRAVGNLVRHRGIKYLRMGPDPRFW